MNLKNHLDIKINIRGEVQKKITKEQFINWNKGRNIKFEIEALKMLKTLKTQIS